MSILVVGSVGLDDVHAPSGSRKRTLGGACSYFSTAASLYDRVQMVGVVGQDFPQEHIDFFQSRDIDLSGLQVVEGKTFFWAGRYGDNLGDAETLDTQLNVFADFHPTIPATFRDAPYVFLANIDPELQLEVLDQVTNPKLVALDSMNFWIATKRDALTKAFRRVDLLLLNETEVLQYSEAGNLLEGAQMLLDLGPKALIIKRGAHGSMLVARHQDAAQRFFMLPAYPLTSVIDPTGAGDTFAAGLMGHLASTDNASLANLRQAMVHGTVVASFTVQGFSVDRLRDLSRGDIHQRYDDIRYMTHFECVTPDEASRFRHQIV